MRNNNDTYGPCITKRYEFFISDRNSRLSIIINSSKSNEDICIYNTSECVPGHKRVHYGKLWTSKNFVYIRARVTKGNGRNSTKNAFSPTTTIITYIWCPRRVISSTSASIYVLFSLISLNSALFHFVNNSIDSSDR